MRKNGSICGSAKGLGSRGGLPVRSYRVRNHRREKKARRYVLAAAEATGGREMDHRTHRNRGQTGQGWRKRAAYKRSIPKVVERECDNRWGVQGTKKNKSRRLSGSMWFSKNGLKEIPAERKRWVRGREKRGKPLHRRNIRDVLYHKNRVKTHLAKQTSCGEA